MAYILNLETATTNCSVSIAKEGELMVLKEHNSANFSHAEQLHVFIQEALEEAALQITQLNAIAVSKGPGSYTGLRIGVSAAKGLCFALNIPLISIPTLTSMAIQRKDTDASFVIPVLDARRMEVYSTVFNQKNEEVRGTEAEVINEDSFEEYEKQGKVLILGSGAEKCLEPLRSKNIEFDTAIIPSAKEMCSLSYEKYASNNFEDVAYFEPFYLKDFVLLTKKKK